MHGSLQACDGATASRDGKGGQSSSGAMQGREGKVVQVYRKKWVIHIERITREKVNGAFFLQSCSPEH